MCSSGWFFSSPDSAIFSDLLLHLLIFFFKHKSCDFSTFSKLVFHLNTFFRSFFAFHNLFVRSDLNNARIPLSLIHFWSGLKWECINRWPSKFPKEEKNQNWNCDNISHTHMCNGISMDFHVHFLCTLFNWRQRSMDNRKSLWFLKELTSLRRKKNRQSEKYRRFGFERCYPNFIKMRRYQTNPKSPSPSNRITRQNGI